MTAHIYPNEHWEHHDSPEHIGFSSKKLYEIKRYLIENTHATGLTVVIAGKVLFQYGDIKNTSYIASCRKSILSILYGIYVDNGIINLSRDLNNLEIDDIQGLLDIEKKATIDDILTARSGIYHPAANGGDDSEFAPQRGSVIPGSYYLYNNWDFNVAGYIFKKLTGIEVYDSLAQDLAIPLDMQDFSREKQDMTGKGDLSRSFYPAYHMRISSRDMARVGYLMLRNGTWKNKQLISKDWVKKITTLVSASSETNRSHIIDEGYGYLWWVYDVNETSLLNGAYMAKGAFGQYLTIIPKLDMVISLKTNPIYERSTSHSAYIQLISMLVNAKTL